MLVAAAEVEDERQRVVLLGVRQQEVQQKRFAAAGGAENECMGDVAAVEVEEVGRPALGFEHGEVLGAEVRVAGLAGVRGELEGESA